MIGDVHHLFIIMNHNRFAMFEGLSRDVLPRQEGKLTLHFCLYLLSRFLALADKQHLAVDAMLCLTEEVGCNEADVACLVGQDFHFTWTCRHINGNIMQTYLLLGTHHKLVARAEYLIDLRHTLRAISHRSYRLHATNLVDATDSSHSGSHKDCGIDASILCRRGAENDVSAACYLCRCGKHKDCAEQGSCAAWNIEAYLLYCHRLLPALHSLVHLDMLALEPLCCMKAFDVLMSKTDGLLEFFADKLLCFCHLAFADSKVIKADLVETLLIFPDRSIAALSNILQDSRDRRIQLRSISNRPPEQVFKFLLNWICVDFH